MQINYCGNGYKCGMLSTALAISYMVSPVYTGVLAQVVGCMSLVVYSYANISFSLRTN